MTKSMTAFARVQSDGFAWEIRSVNQRYLDASFKIPEHMRVLEPELRTILREHLHRGKVDCLLRTDLLGHDLDDPQIDSAELHRLMRLVDHIATVSTNLAPMDPLDVLRWPGILKEDSEEFESLLEKVKDQFATALRSLVDMREREGRKLANIVLERLDELCAIIESVRAQAPGITGKLSAKLRERIGELSTEVDQGRLEQELVYLAQKADIQEELDRLDAHVAEIRSALDSDKPVGRRLDFLMQELNREANTLSSKSSAAETSIQAVELKVVIEQMREQVQNIE